MRLVPRVPLRSAIRCVLFVVLATGCGGERGVIVRGKVVKNGQPLKVQSGDTIAIYFVTTEEGQRSRSLAIYHVADGTFVCDGPNRTGIPKGRHRIEMWPARADLPKLTGNRRALAQATWRHVLFAVVLGVLEERLNQGFRVDVPEVPVSSNGHGDIEFAVGAAT